MKKTIIIIVVIIAFAGVFWYLWTINKTPQPVTTDIKNSTYSIDGQPVTLVNGRAEISAVPDGVSKTITQYFGNQAEGDLNGDGLPDTAFILTRTGDGSGTFYYVVVALKTTEGYQGTNAILLGDRIAPQTTEITNGQLIVNYADRKPDEPMTTAPSIGISRYLKIQDMTLVETRKIVGAGESCGGNMTTAPVCITGYHCAPRPGSSLPLGDVGGICVADFPLVSYTDETSGVTFQYPKLISAKYVATVDWPPKLALTDGPFSCTEAGSEITPAGKTVRRVIGDNVYCITNETQGAAGSIYTQYAYATTKGDKVPILTFSLRFVQCGNYEEPKKTECQNEQDTFNIDSVIDNIFSTFKFLPPPAQTSTGIFGTVLLGPTCPTMYNPPMPECADKPYKTALLLVTSGNNQTIKQFNSDDFGKFNIDVSPGNYIIRGVQGTSSHPSCSSGTISVTPNTRVNVTVSCDTGIR